MNGDIEATATLEVGGTSTLTGKATLADDIEMTKQSCGITHTAATDPSSGLKITSTHGFVDVESVRFTGAQIGIDGDVDIITLSSAAVAISASATVSSTLGVQSDFSVGASAATPTFKVTASSGDLAIATNKFTVAGSSGDAMTAGKLAVSGAAPANTDKELYVNGDIETTATLEVGAPRRCRALWTSRATPR